MTARSAPIRIAIVGCGAVAERLHLPALAGSTRVRVSALVDVSEERLRRLGGRFGIAQLHTRPEAVRDHADIAIVAVPHHLHADVSIKLIEAGVHVLVEKPLATSCAEATAMLAAATACDRRIGVGLVRRYFPTFREVAAVLERGWLGRLRSFDYREGGRFAWPVASEATFRRATAGGVLLDTGSHALDTLIAWLGEPLSVVYFDDSAGGVDANCLLHLTFADDLRGIVELSRTRTLRNTCILRGERGELEAGLAPDSVVSVRVNGMQFASTALPGTRRGVDVLALARQQVEDFAAVAVGGLSDWPLLAERTLGSIRLFDRARQQRQQLDLPWTAFTTLPDLAGLRGRRVLVLGGTGFIGGRLVEALAGMPEVRIRVLARSLAALANVARFNVEIAHGDVSDPPALAHAMQGCDIVVNCTYGDGSLAQARRLNVQAVESIIREAAQAGTRRVIHMSSVSAYGQPPDGDLDESASLHAGRSDPYGHSKWEGEVAGLALAARSQVELVIIQPTIVFGPAAPTWTVRPLSLLKRGRIALVNGGAGLCNPVYVDDVVQAILRAAVVDAAHGERFLVSGPGPVSWQAFYAAYEAMLGRAGAVSMSVAQVRSLQRAARQATGLTALVAAVAREPTVFAHISRWRLAQTVHRLLPRSSITHMKNWVGRDNELARDDEAAPPLVHVSDAEVWLQTSRVRVVTAKAERVLGYVPAIDLDEGMRRTGEWARWANLLT